MYLVLKACPWRPPLSWLIGPPYRPGSFPPRPKSKPAWNLT